MAAMPPFSIGINWRCTDGAQLASSGIPDYANERTELVLSALPTRNRIYRAIWTADSYVSSAVFELWRGLKAAGSAYSSWLYRWFRLSGLKRVVVDLADDGFTFLVVVAFGLLAFA